MQLYLIILIVVLGLVIFGTNIYVVVHYIHPEQKGFKDGLGYKLLIIIGMTVCEWQALMVPMDIGNRSAILPSLDMHLLWMISSISLLSFITVLLPYAIFFYQSDPEATIISRVLRSLCYLFCTVLICSLVFVISYLFLKFVDLPYTELSVDVSEQQSSDKTVDTQLTLTFQTSIGVYAIAILSFAGWILLVLCGGCGFWTLGLDMIAEFRNRPRARHTSSIQETQKQLTRVIKNLLTECEEVHELLDQQERNQQAGVLQKWKTSRQSNNKFTKTQAKYFAVSNEFTLFNLELKYANSNPILPFLRLLLGMLFLITSLIWFLQMVLGGIVMTFVQDFPIPFINDLLIELEDNDLSLLSMLIFAYLALYLVWVLLKGTITFTTQAPFFLTLHRMKQHGTWLNSMLVNVILMSLGSVGVMQLCVWSFPTYTRNTELFTIFDVQVQYLRFYTIFYRYAIFPIAFMSWALLNVIWSCIKCCQPTSYMEEIYQLRSIRSRD